jgi:hypothetical protein
MTELDLAVALVLENLPDSITQRARVLGEVAALLGEKHPLRNDVLKQIHSLDFATEHPRVAAAKFRNLEA